MVAHCINIPVRSHYDRIRPCVACYKVSSFVAKCRRSIENRYFVIIINGQCIKERIICEAVNDSWKLSMKYFCFRHVLCTQIILLLAAEGTYDKISFMSIEIARFSPWGLSFIPSICEKGISASFLCMPHALAWNPVICLSGIKWLIELKKKLRVYIIQKLGRVTFSCIFYTAFPDHTSWWSCLIAEKSYTSGKLIQKFLYSLDS